MKLLSDRRRRPRGPVPSTAAALPAPVAYLGLAVATLLTAGPLFLLFVTSLKSTIYRGIDFSVLRNPSAETYRQILFEQPFGRWLVNSLVVATTVTFGVLFLDSLAGYAFAKKRFRGKEALFMSLVATLAIPLAVILLPTFLLITHFGLVDTYWALILPGLALPVGVFMMRQFIQTIPTELEEAARIDGMSDFGIYLRIILPLSVPGLAVLGLFTFMTQWALYLWPLIIATSDRSRMIAPGLATLPTQFSTDWGLVAAATLLSMIPMVLVFVMCQRYLTRGLVTGRGGKQ